MENQQRPQAPVLSVKKVALKEPAQEMMTIEDNSDLRAAMNFAKNAARKVLHVYIITRDAPKSGDITSTEKFPLKHDESFRDAVRELNKNSNQSRDVI
jgi:hypothetical protein